MPAIVPVELTLPSGRWYTLYQRDWDDADDDSRAFLGTDDQVIAFASPDELSSYAGSDAARDGHHLVDSALWPDVRHRNARDFTPADGDRHDLLDGRREREVLAELCEFLGLEPPYDWLRESIPLPGSVTGVPSWIGGPGPNVPDPWAWALAAVDRRVGPPVPARQGTGCDAHGAAQFATPVETVAPGVEVRWLGLAGVGATTLFWHGDDGEVRCLGQPGELLAAPSQEALRAYLADADDTVLGQEPWAPLRGRDDLDLEPYEDSVVDLDEAADAISATMTSQDAETLLAGWAVMHEVADWTGADDVLAALGEDARLGRFLVRDVLDMTPGSGAARRRLADTDLDEVAESWRRCLTSLAERVVWIDGGD